MIPQTIAHGQGRLYATIIENVASPLALATASSAARKP